MKDQTQLDNATASHNDRSRRCWRCGLFILAVAVGIGWSVLAPFARAVSPPPDGGYANGNTAEGTDALYLLTTGSNNTAVGNDALHDNTTGGSNAAVGGVTLLRNTTGSANSGLGYGALSANTTASDNTAI